MSAQNNGENNTKRERIWFSQLPADEQQPVVHPTDVATEVRARSPETMEDPAPAPQKEIFVDAIGFDFEPDEGTTGSLRIPSEIDTRETTISAITPDDPTDAELSMDDADLQATAVDLPAPDLDDEKRARYNQPTRIEPAENIEPAPDEDDADTTSYRAAEIPTAPDGQDDHTQVFTSADMSDFFTANEDQPEKSERMTTWEENPNGSGFAKEVADLFASDTFDEEEMPIPYGEDGFETDEGYAVGPDTSALDGEIIPTNLLPDEYEAQNSRSQDWAMLDGEDEFDDILASTPVEAPQVSAPASRYNESTDKTMAWDALEEQEDLFAAPGGKAQFANAATPDDVSREGGNQQSADDIDSTLFDPAMYSSPSDEDEVADIFGAQGALPDPWAQAAGSAENAPLEPGDADDLFAGYQFGDLPDNPEATLPEDYAKDFLSQGTAPEDLLGRRARASRAPEDESARAPQDMLFPQDADDLFAGFSMEDMPDSTIGTTLPEDPQVLRKRREEREAQLRGQADNNTGAAEPRSSLDQLDALNMQGLPAAPGRSPDSMAAYENMLPDEDEDDELLALPAEVSAADLPPQVSASDEKRRTVHTDAAPTVPAASAPAGDADAHDHSTNLYAQGESPAPEADIQVSSYFDQALSATDLPHAQLNALAQAELEDDDDDLDAFLGEEIAEQSEEEAEQQRKLMQQTLVEEQDVLLAEESLPNAELVTPDENFDEIARSTLGEEPDPFADDEGLASGENLPDAFSEEQDEEPYDELPDGLPEDLPEELPEELAASELPLGDDSLAGLDAVAPADLLSEEIPQGIGHEGLNDEYKLPDENAEEESKPAPANVEPESTPYLQIARDKLNEAGQKVIDIIDIKNNWGFYVDMVAAVIMTISSAVLLANFITG